MQIDRRGEWLRLYTRFHKQRLIRRWMVYVLCGTEQPNGPSRTGIQCPTPNVEVRNQLDGRNSSSVDDELGAINIRGTIGHQESNELGNFVGAAGTPGGDAAE